MIVRRLIFSISTKWVCNNRAVPKLPWSFSFHLSLRFLSSTWAFLWHQSLSCRCKGMAAGFGNKRSSLRFSEKSPHRWVVFVPKNLVFPASPPLKSTWNETTDATGRRKKKCRKKERQRGEETKTSLQFLEPQIILIQGSMTTNINMGQTLWRLLSAVSTSIISLVVWLGYMALGIVGEVILGVVSYIFGITLSFLSVLVLIGAFIWLLTL